MSAPPRRRGAPVVARVLDATLEDLAERGYARLSVPDVAARAGVNKTSVYRRWPTKPALVAAALSRALGHDAPLPDTGDLRGDMRAFTLAAVAWAASPVGRAVLQTLHGEAGDAELRAVVSALLQARAASPLALFTRAQSRGELAADADVSLALTVIAGAIWHRMVIEAAPVSPAFVERLVALVAGGLGARSV
jgi:AcrR family transcriptional regulator